MLAPFGDTRSQKFGCINAVGYRTDFESDTQPFCSVSYRVGPKICEREDLKVQKQLEADLVEPTTSEWASPVLFVPMNDGSFCSFIDYQHLNRVTVKDTCLLPCIDDCIDSFGTAKIFSTMDGNSGYLQIPVKDRDREKKASYFTRVYINTSAGSLV